MTLTAIPPLPYDERRSDEARPNLGSRIATITQLLVSLPDVLERPSDSGDLGDGDEPIRTSRDYRTGSYAELEHTIAKLAANHPRTWRHLQRRYLTCRLVRRDLRYTERKVHGLTRRDPVLPGPCDLVSAHWNGREQTLTGVLRVWDNPVDPQHVQNGLRYLSDQWPTVCVSCDGTGRTRQGRCRTCTGSGEARKPTLPPDMTVAA